MRQEITEVLVKEIKQQKLKTTVHILRAGERIMAGIKTNK